MIRLLFAVLYAAGASLTTRVMGRWLVAVDRRDFPGQRPGEDGLALVFFLGTVWPLGFPLGYLLFGPDAPWRRTAARWVFGDTDERGAE